MIEGYDAFEEHSHPLFSFEPSSPSTFLRFHPSEHHLLVSCHTDRSIQLFDVRENNNKKNKSYVRKMTLAMRSNCFDFNPQFPSIFTVGNEDHNCYSFDIRNFGSPLHIYNHAHVNSVLSVSYNPDGQTFATGSYDQTVRIFPSHFHIHNYQSGTANSQNIHSMEFDNVYYNRRMQRVFVVQHTPGFLSFFFHVFHVFLSFFFIFFYLSKQTI